MSNKKYTYIGNYLRVWMPTYFAEEKDPQCPNCPHRCREGDFCINCGTKKVMKKLECREDPYELFEEIFGDGDRFHDVYDWEQKVKYDILLPNCGQDGGETVGDEFEAKIPGRGVSHSDWHKLTAELEKRNIQHEFCYGVVNYWM